MRRLARTARVVLIGSAIGVTSTCSHLQLGGVVGAAEAPPSVTLLERIAAGSGERHPRDARAPRSVVAVRD